MVAPIPDPDHNPDRSPWNWLLLIPIVVPLIPVFFNSLTPTLFGFPRFYWLQLAYILVGVSVTTLVYQLSRGTSRSGAPGGSTGAASGGSSRGEVE
jgi:hypothetical protein